MDLSKLTPAPWRTEDAGPDHRRTIVVADCNEAPLGFVAVAECASGVADNPADAAFIALSRNAFDIMMRRKWSPLKSPVEGQGWRVDTNDGEYFSTMSVLASYREPDHWPDPFTALVEADRWHVENVESK